MLKKRSVLKNVLTAIPAVLLSLLLIVCLVASGFYSVVLQNVSAQSISDMTRTVVSQLVEDVDFEEVIMNNETVKKKIEELAITNEAVEEILQSEAANEIIDLLAADMSNLLTDPNAPVQLTDEAIVQIVKDHADELAQIAVDMSDEPIDKEELKTQIIETVEQDSAAFTDALPDMAEMRVTVTQQMPVEQITRWLNPTYLWAGFGLCALLAALIYLCRFYRFGGFMWLGVDMLLTGGIFGAIAVALRVVNLGDFVDLGSAANIVRSLIWHISGTVQTRMWIFLGLAVVLIVSFILLRVLVVKKKLAALAAQPAVVGKE